MNGKVVAEALTPEQVAKARFVSEELGPMLSGATRGWVREAWYEAYTCGHEVVRVAYGEYGMKPDELGFLAVNVTADSHWAIAKDVMAAVGAKFE